ncbi:MAG: nucleoside kinase [Oscillospiraceae bacterium]|nr:nucleoside kinase [Oscillospiraceae bacterium]
MAFQLSDINFRTVADPKGFLEECDATYQSRVEQAADKILQNQKNSPIVLLSGPSGSGKTTTAMKISEALERRGIHSHYVALDDYFNTVDPATTPRTPEGDLDLESPLCLDMELLNRHFTQLARGERIYVPKYEFSRRMRIQEPSKAIKLKKDELVIFEGIHALNDMITVRHPEAFKLYISASSDVEFGGKVVFKRTWFRLVRRTVRDYLFRGSDPANTMSMWANVRRGEKHNISPFKDKADFQFDTTFPYEPAVLNRTATMLFQSVPEGIERFEELRAVLPAIQLFGIIDESLVAPDAVIREFIGGGIYEY